ncbi:MAG: D-2-hydroxyacid dehydrogenase family protein [Alphaproteobacteria bacterium]|nr:D-2-hydroxyacid dehydrogenase family protein [Alphaproteobacteria bacterium]
MRLAIINDYQELALKTTDWGRLPDSIEVDVFHDQLTDGQEAAARLQPYDIIVTAREETRFDQTLINSLPNLKLLVFHGARNAALDLTTLDARGVAVCGTGYGFTNGTVELAWALVLGLVKRLPQEDAAIRAGGWGAGLPFGLTGKTLGVLGLGTLGTGVARVGQALDMDVVAWSPNLTEERCRDVGVRKVDKEALFRKSDVLSIHVILSERTRGLVSAADLASMKSSAYLINTSRGPIVDEAALVAALEADRIAGAGLDVFDIEPLPDTHPFRRLPNVLVTSHIGGRTYENFAARYGDCLEDVLAWLDGKPLRVVSPE